jgi:hypothetical protein
VEGQLQRDAAAVAREIAALQASTARTWADLRGQAASATAAHAAHRAATLAAIAALQGRVETAERDDGAALAQLETERAAVAADTAALERDVTGTAAGDRDAFLAKMERELQAVDEARGAAAAAAAAGIARLRAGVEAAQRTISAQQARPRPPPARPSQPLLRDYTRHSFGAAAPFPAARVGLCWGGVGWWGRGRF